MPANAAINQRSNPTDGTTHPFQTELVNEAVREALREDREDLSEFEERAGEPSMTYEDLLKELLSRKKP